MNKALIVALLTCLSMGAAEVKMTSTELRKLTFDQKINAQIPLGLRFRDDSNQSVTFRDCLAGKPAILILGYFECPMLCNLVLNGVVESLQEIKPGAASQAQLIFVSINPAETPALASAKKRTYLKRLARPGSEQSWHFLCGEPDEIEQLTTQAGFYYRYDATHKQYAHPSGILIITPEGRISRYFFGVNFPAVELQKALADAAHNQSGSPIQAFLLLCSQFVPLTGKFSGTVMAAVRIVAVATVIAIAGVAFFCRRGGERHRS